MPERYRRYFLKAKESKYLLSKASERLRVDLREVFGDKAKVEAIQTEFAEIFLINGKPAVVRTEQNFHPVLTFKEFFEVAPKVVVDMGAIPYVCKGANVMAPGIRRLEGDFKKGDFVFIIDEKHGKPIALGEAVYDANEARNAQQGVVVKNVHFVGDRIWNLTKGIGAQVC